MKAGHRRTLRQLASCRRGAAAIEFSIIGLLLIVVCLGLLEIGRGLYLRNELSFAADFAARKILTNPTIPHGELEDELRTAFTGIDPALVNISFGSETHGGIQFRTIELRYPFSSLVPGLADSAIELSLSRRVPLGG